MGWQVSSQLSRMGASEEAIADITKSLFTGSGAGTVRSDHFVKRAQRLQSPLLLGAAPGPNTKRDLRAATPTAYTWTRLAH